MLRYSAHWQLRQLMLIFLTVLCTALLCACVETDFSADENGIAPADVICGSSVIFRSVYCTGDNCDTPVRHSFIELYNTSDKTVSLDRLYLGYAKGQQQEYTMYAFPQGAEIAPGASYLIRCAAAVSEDGVPYLDDCEKFTLSHYDADFPTLVLSAKRTRLILADTALPLKQSDLTSGRVLAYFGACAEDAEFPFPANSRSLDKHTAILRTDDNTAWQSVDYTAQTCLTITDVTPTSSAGRITDIPLSGVDVIASTVGGRYSDTAIVKLKTLPGYQIVYSLDCEDDLKAFTPYRENQQIHLKDTTASYVGYTAKLLVEKYENRVKPRIPTVGGRVLRACVTDGTNFGPVMTQTYFVMPDIADYDDILFMNITLDPDDFTGEDGIYAVISDDIFAYRPQCDGYMEIFDAEAGTSAAQYVRLTMNGNGSLSFCQKSMRVSVREKDTLLDGGTLSFDLFDGDAVDAQGQPITEFKTFVLRNSGNDASRAHFRDALMQRLSASLNACTQAYRPALLFINGEFWGLYNVRERYSTDYFYRHFGILPENLVMLETISPLLTDSWNTPYALNEGEEGDEQDFYDLVDYAAAHDMKNPEHFAWVEARMDLDNFTDFFIASCYLANTDWPGNNIKVWRCKNPADPSGMDTRWRWVLSDMDFGIGHSTSADQQMFTHALTEDTVCGKLMTRLLRNTAFRLRFADRAAELCNTVYSPENTLPALYEIAAGVEPFLHLNFDRWRGDGGSMTTWESHVVSAETFLAQRTRYFMRELQGKLGVVMDTVTADGDHAAVTVNGIAVTDGASPLYFRDSTKITVTAEAHNGYRVTGFRYKIGPMEHTAEGDTLTFELYAKTTITVITEPIS